MRRLGALTWSADRQAVALALVVIVAVGCASPVDASLAPTTTTATAPTQTEEPSLSNPMPIVGAGEPWIVYMAKAPAGIGIYLARPDGSDSHLLDFGAPGSFKHPDWSPDGRRIVAVREDDNTIWTIGVDGGDPRKLPIASCVDVCDYPAFSPDGTGLAFSVIESRDGFVGPAAGAIHLADLDGSNERILARAVRPEVLDNPRWSPDGARLVFEIDRFDLSGFETGCSIAVVDVANREITRRTEPLLFGSFPDWGADGIVFSEGVRVYREGIDPVADSFDLWLVGPDEGEPMAITRVAETVHLLQPSWTPDGRSIIATLEQPGRRVGAVVDPATGNWAELGAPMSFARLRPTP